MVTYMCWIERTGEVPLEVADRRIREMAESQGHELRDGQPIEYWRKEGKSGVEICAEQFPGSRPIWLWEA
jgi:hypothetical protein